MRRFFASPNEKITSSNYTLSYVQVLIATLLLSIGQCFGQSLSQKEKALFASLERLGDWNWHETPEVDADSLVTVISKGLVNELKTKVYNENHSIHNLSITTSPDSLIRIYTFSYFSGGTRGSINNSVIQFKKPTGGYLVADSGIEATFNQIHLLPSSEKTLYLLIGEEKNDNTLYMGITKLIEILDDTISLDYLGFAGKYSTLLYYDTFSPGDYHCFSSIEYDVNSLQLSFCKPTGEDNLYGWPGFQDVDNTKFHQLIFEGEQFINQK